MTVAFRSAVSTGQSSGNVGSTGVPAGATLGDLQVVVLAISGSADDIKRPANWTMLINDWTSGGSSTTKIILLYRFYDGSDGSPSFQFYDGSAAWGFTHFLVSGVHPTYPIGGFNYSINSVDATNIDIPSVKCNVSGSKVFSIVVGRGSTGNFAPPFGYTERVDNNGGGSVRRGIGVSDLDVDEGTVPATQCAQPVTEPSIGVQLLLNPAEAGLQATDWKFPTVAASVSATSIGLADGLNWSSATGVSSDGGVIASHFAAATGFDGDLLKCTGFGFSIPAGARVAGIELELEARSWFSGNHGTGTKFLQYSSALYRAGTPESFIKINNMKIPVEYDSDTGGGSNSPWLVRRVGGPGDVWQGDWTKADIEDANFGAYVLDQMTLAEGPDSGGSNIVSGIDYIKMRVYFVPPAYPDASV